MDRCACPNHLHSSEDPNHPPHEDGLPEASDHDRGSSRFPLWGRLSRFFLWWLIFAGVYASSSVCPFCGQAGCPVGAASAGVVGGVFAFLITGAKQLLTSFKRFWPMGRSSGGVPKTGG